MRLKNMVPDAATVAAAAVFLLIGHVDRAARAALVRIRPSIRAVFVRVHFTFARNAADRAGEDSTSQSPNQRAQVEGNVR